VISTYHKYVLPADLLEDSCTHAELLSYLYKERNTKDEESGSSRTRGIVTPRVSILSSKGVSYL
jgi:hypothetical protein